MVNGESPEIRIRPIAASLILIVTMLIANTCVDATVAANFSRGAEAAKKFGVHEIVLTGNGAVSNPFDTDVMVTFTPPSGAANAVTVKAFYDGANLWRARLYVSESGKWTWASRSSDDKQLDGGKGYFSVVASNLRGKLRQHPKNKRSWATDDGRTFLNLADTAYILFRSPNHSRQPLDDKTFQDYVRANVRLGVTSMRAGGCGGYAGWGRTSTGASPASDRSNWCWRKDYDPSGANKYWERFDLDRLQTTDRRLEWLLNNYPDMYIQLIMFSKTYGSKAGFAKRWFEIPELGRRRTVDYVIARWSAWPQVFYLIVNDAKYFNYDTDEPIEVNQRMMREIGHYMARIEPFATLRSAGGKVRHDNPFTLPSDWTWHTYLHSQRTAQIAGSVCDHYYREKNVAVHVYNGEDFYEQDVRAVFEDARYYFRRLFWSNLLSGGSTAYGGRYPVLHPYDTTGGRRFDLPRPKLHFTEQLVGLDDIIHIKRFFEQRNIDLALFEPDDGAAEAVGAPKPEPDGPSRAQCSRRGYDEYLIYLPCSRDGERGGGGFGSDRQKTRAACNVDVDTTPGVTVNLTGASGTFKVEWYRPGDGASRNGTPVYGRANRKLTSPWQGSDVVLRLLKTD